MKGNLIFFLAMLIAVEHIWFAIMSFFRWRKGFARDLVGLDDESAGKTEGLGRYLALYCLFVGVALMWETIMMNYSNSNAAHFMGLDAQKALMTYLVFVGGAGGFFVHRSFYVLQAVPAALWLVVNAVL